MKERDYWNVLIFNTYCVLVARAVRNDCNIAFINKIIYYIVLIDELNSYKLSFFLLLCINYLFDIVSFILSRLLEYYCLHLYYFCIRLFIMFIYYHPRYLIIINISTSFQTPFIKVVNGWAPPEISFRFKIWCRELME